MAAKPKVFVTRIIPDAGLRLIKAQCDAEVWTDPLPPPYAVLRQKVADCDGLVSLLTDKIDAALLDAAPRLRVVSNFAVGFNNIDVPAATPARHRRRQHARRADRRHRRHGLLPAHRRRPPGGRRAAVQPLAASGRPGSRSATSARTWPAGRSASSAWAGSATPWPSAATAAGT